MAILLNSRHEKFSQLFARYNRRQSTYDLRRSRHVQGTRLFQRLLAASVLFCGIAYGQGERATVTGTVNDPSGRIVVNPHVSIRNVPTNYPPKTTPPHAA